MGDALRSAPPDREPRLRGRCARNRPWPLAPAARRLRPGAVTPPTGFGIPCERLRATPRDLPPTPTTPSRSDPLRNRDRLLSASRPRSRESQIPPRSRGEQGEEGIRRSLWGACWSRSLAEPRPASPSWRRRELLVDRVAQGEDRGLRGSRLGLLRNWRRRASRKRDPANR